MDIRVLTYFLEVTDKGSIAKAADSLLTTAPNISRQISALEKELGVELFHKKGRYLELTEDGLFLKERAKKIIALSQRTEEEIKNKDKEISGNIFIGAAETPAMRMISGIVAYIAKNNPSVTFRFRSADFDFVSDGLDSGILDFGILAEPADIKKYGHIKLPVSDQWGLLMRVDNPLAKLPSIRPEDLQGVPLMCSDQMLAGNGLAGWYGRNLNELNFVVKFNLVTTPAMLAEAGIGCVLTFNNLVTTEGTNLCFRRLNPMLETGLYLVWRENQHFSRAAQLFLNEMQEAIENIT